MSSTFDRRHFLRLSAAGAGLGGLSLLPVGPSRAADDENDDGADAASGPDREPARQPELGQPEPFSAERLRRRAKALAESPWRAPDAALPPALDALDYDGLRDIRYARERALWADAPHFSVEFFHLGGRQVEPVAMHVVADGAAREVLYSPALFDFGKNDFAAGDLAGVQGFAGARILHPLNTAAYKDELGAFLGASYFRLLGETMLYGLSARGLAIDTAGERPEEFPVFRELYFEAPDGPDALVVHALLDSPSVAGAFRFEIRPGADTVVDVDAALCPRVDLPGIGVAPLTSMFLFGPNDRDGVDDFRPAVHDSNGLLMHAGTGEWLWRPVANPEAVRLSTFTDPNARGFGLMQRERRFGDYHDLEARYERRPSAWVEPVGDWGPGQVVLAELPTPDETEDNLVAFWRPDAVPAAGAELRLGYRLHWCLAVPDGGTGPLRAIATRAGSGDSIGVDPEDDPERGTRLFSIDFAGPDLPEADAPVEVVVTVSGGELSSAIVARNGPLDAWRAYVRVRPGRAAPSGTSRDAAPETAAVERIVEEPVEIRCYLALGERALSETWLYRWEA